MDAQLPPALARRIQAYGHTAEHVADCGLAMAPDEQIRRYATTTNAVIVTKDEDFAVRHVLHGGPAVVWIRVGNIRRAELVRRIETEWTTILDALERDETLVEVA